MKRKEEDFYGRLSQPPKNGSRRRDAPKPMSDHHRGEERGSFGVRYSLGFPTKFMFPLLFSPFFANLLITAK